MERRHAYLPQSPNLLRTHRVKMSATKRSPLATEQAVHWELSHSCSVGRSIRRQVDRTDDDDNDAPIPITTSDHMTAHALFQLTNDKSPKDAIFLGRGGVGWGVAGDKKWREGDEGG